MKINSIEPNKLTPLSLGDKVIVIDFDEDPTECAVFCVSDHQNHRFCLTPIDRQHSYEPLWVERQDVRLLWF